jgi:CDP-diacylglycerol---serine O-phosphatidyltransferase
MSDEADPQQRPRGVYWLPNLLTTGALFAGFYAAVAAIDGRFDRAGIAVFVAMVFDGLDGRVARWTNTESAFGKEYDSLSDMVSFGVAPAIVTYQWGVERITEYGLLWRRLGWLVCFLYAATAALRLARFNSRYNVQDTRYFQGLPSPSAAAMVAAFVWYASEYDLVGLPALIVAFFVTACAGGLMISQFPYHSFKQVEATSRVRFAYFLLVPLTFAVISVDPPRILFMLFTAFALSAPIQWLVRKVSGRPTVPDND